MNFTNLTNFMEHMSEKMAPGCAIEVYKDGEKVYSYACGYSDLENRTPMTGEEMFNIYSCSKIATATAGMQLLERGKFILTEPLYEYMPEFKEMYIKTANGELVKAKKPITIGDLFSMTAGFEYEFDTPGFKKAREITEGRMDTVETIRCAAADPLKFEPGTHWQYSICHDVLGALISVVSGKKFRDYVKENIFDPLEMHDTFYHHTPETLERTAMQYDFVTEAGATKDIVEAQKNGSSKNGVFVPLGKEVCGHVLGPEFDSGGAGIVTTVSDYAKFMAALANYGVGLTGERIISRHAIDLMKTNRLDEELLKDFNWIQMTGCGYGLGVRAHINPAKSGLMCNPSEFGWGGAAGATGLVDPAINLGVFFAQHVLNPREEYYQPRLRNVVYSCLD